MRNRQGIQKSSLVEEESDMKRNEFEALALLGRRVKEIRANGEIDAQHDAGAATQPQKQIKKESRDFGSSFCEFRNKRVTCRNFESLSGKQEIMLFIGKPKGRSRMISSGKQNKGREWV